MRIRISEIRFEVIFCFYLIKCKVNAENVQFFFKKMILQKAFTEWFITNNT